MADPKDAHSPQVGQNPKPQDACSPQNPQRWGLGDRLGCTQLTWPSGLAKGLARSCPSAKACSRARRSRLWMASRRRWGSLAPPRCTKRLSMYLATMNSLRALLQGGQHQCGNPTPSCLLPWCHSGERPLQKAQDPKSSGDSGVTHLVSFLIGIGGEEGGKAGSFPSTHPALPQTHISLPAEGLGQSCVGSVASMISLKRVFPTLTASWGDRAEGVSTKHGGTSPQPHILPPCHAPSSSQRGEFTRST